MSTSEKYKHLAKFYYYMKIPLFVDKEILRLIDDINYAMPPDSPIIRRKPEYLGYTAMHFAVEDRNIFFVVRLLYKHGVDLSLRSHYGYSPLRLAAEYNSKNASNRCFDLEGQIVHENPILIILLHEQVESQNVANVSCRNGISHFHLACMVNDVISVSFFLDVAGVSVNQAVNADSSILPGYTALHFAVRYSSLEVVQMLLEHEADVTLGDASGTTPLQLLIERILELTDVIDPNEKVKSFSREFEVCNNILKLMMRLSNSKPHPWEWSALHVNCALTVPDMDAIRLHIEHERNVNAAVASNSPVRPGYTPLHFAAHSSFETVKLLLTYGANIAVKDSRGVTPFDIGIARFTIKDMAHILESIETLKDISFSNGSLLSNVTQAIEDATLIDQHLHHQVELSSPLWPGHSMLHLIVEFTPKTVDSIAVQNKLEDKNTISGTVTSENSEDQSKNSENPDWRCWPILRTCFETGDAMVQNAHGMTALHLAFRQGKTKLVHTLIRGIRDNGIRTNPSDFGGLSHLHIYCAAGNESMVEAILSNRTEEFDIDQGIQSSFEWKTTCEKNVLVRPGSTALHIAVAFNRHNILKMLVHYNANVLATDNDGVTPLHLEFAIDCDLGVLNTMLSSASATRANPESSEGLSHFHIACYTDKVDVAEKLLSQGLANVETQVNCQLNDTYADRPDGIKANEHVCSNHFLPMAPYSGYRALHMAVSGNAQQTLKLLLRYGADVHSRNSLGLSPLQLTLQKLHGYNQYSCPVEIDPAKLRFICDRLVENEVNLDGLTRLLIACLKSNAAAVEEVLTVTGVDVNAQLSADSPIWPRSTVLQVLDFEDDPNVLELLVQRGANINMLCNGKMTHLHNAYYCSDSQKIDILLQSPHVLAGNPVDDAGLSHFHVACAYGEATLVEAFLDHGLAQLDQPKDYFGHEECGFAPLHFATKTGNYAVIDVLLRRGANLFSEDLYGNTLIHLAARDCLHLYNVIDLFKRFLEAGIDVNSSNIFGETPLELCLMNDADGNQLQFLLKHRACATQINLLKRIGLLQLALCKSLLTFQLILNYANKITDIHPKMGYNAIHSVIFGNNRKISYSQYAYAIGRLIKEGCDINLQDAEGKTPLHIAAHATTLSDNQLNVKALLNFGADININDNSGKPPTFEWQHTTYYTNTLLHHCQKLFFLKLHISSENKKHYDEWLENHNCNTVWNRELQKIREVEVFQGFNLGILLNDSIVKIYPTLNKKYRQAIFEKVESKELFKNFPELGCVIKLQHGRALRRIKLVESAKTVLSMMMVPPIGLTEYCLESIIKHLDNEELMILIENE